MTKETEALKLALEVMQINLTLLKKIDPYKGQDDLLSDSLDMTHEAIAFIEAALAQPAQEPTCPECKAAVLYECVACSSNNYPPLPVQERNFCPRCGKRTADLTTIHTCTPPRENT
jgi:hypothetical protein